MNIKKLQIGNEIKNAIDILKMFENDPKAKECLDIYRRLPENKQNTLLIVMDAFSLGIARLKKEGRDAQDALEILKKAIGILGN